MTTQKLNPVNYYLSGEVINAKVERVALNQSGSLMLFVEGRWYFVGQGRQKQTRNDGSSYFTYNPALITAPMGTNGYPALTRIYEQNNFFK